MAAPTPGETAWWHEQDAFLGSEPSPAQHLYARPSVTTGASLPWGGKASSNLGPPRAFHAGPQSIPTITVTSSQPGVTNLVCKPDSSKPAALHSPFAEIAASRDIFHPDSANCSHNIIPKSWVEVQEPLAQVETGGIDYPKQESLQSAATSFTLDTTQPSAQGQVITTAQDEQGVAITIGASMQNGELSRKLGLTFQGTPPPSHQGVITTNASLQTKEAPVRDPPERQMPALPLPGGSPEGSPAKRGGLRSSSSPETQDMQNEASEELQDADLINLDTQSTDMEADDDDVVLNHEAQRRIRRRNNNRESAKRVREKRDADLKAVTAKVARLQEVQVQLLEHCSQMDSTCRDLSGKLQQVHSQLESSTAENFRLTSEVEHLRRNVRVGEQRRMGLKIDGHEDYHPLPTELSPAAARNDGQAGGLLWHQVAFNSLGDQYSQDWKSW